MKNHNHTSLRAKIAPLLLAGVFLMPISSVIAEEAGAGAGGNGASNTATVNVQTIVVNNNGGFDMPDDFIMHVAGAGASPSVFAGSSAGTAVTVTASSSYSVSVNPGSVYVATLSPDCASTLEAGDTVTCIVTLNDTPQLPTGSIPPNLIPNPSFEIVSSSNSNAPADWLNGGYGTNDRTFLYPIEATSSDIASGNAVRLTISSYTDGDAKWYFEPVAVKAGKQYSFSDSYVATAPTQLIAEYFDANKTHIGYGGFISLPATPANIWKKANMTMTIPAGTAYVTVFHTLGSVGSLTLDNYNLSEVALPTPFTKGFVSLTFDDSVSSQYDNARGILNSHSLKATFYVISHLVSGLSVKNSSFETADASKAHTPAGWLTTGSASSTFSYPVDGHTGSAAEASAEKANSNAGWYFTPITVFPDGIYTFGEWYKSTAATTVVAQYTTAAGTVAFADVVNAQGETLGKKLAVPSSNGEWTELPTTYFYIPENAKTVTVIHRLTGVGNLAVDDIAFGAKSYMSAANVLSLQADGHEIGGHTLTHPDLAAIPLADATTEITDNRTDLMDGGIIHADSIAYPYGSYNQDVERVSQNAGYTSGRSVASGFNGRNADKFGLMSQSVNADTTLDQVKAWIDQARADRTWLILTFHDIAADVSSFPYGATPSTLQGIADYLVTTGIQVHTVNDGLVLMNTDVPSDTIAPILTLNGSSTVDLFVGDTYTELGAAAADNVDQTVVVVIGGDAVNTGKVGSYHVTYNAADTAGNHAAEIVRTVNVASSTSATTTPDIAAPVITLTGSTTIDLFVGENYTEFGATATDNVDQTVAVVINATELSTTTPGTYHITYNAVDAAGNHAIEQVRTVVVSAGTTPPPTPVPPPAPAPSGGGGHSSGGGSSKPAHATFTLLDFNTLVINWGKSGTSNPADFNKDGRIDILDFNMLIINWSR